MTQQHIDGVNSVDSVPVPPSPAADPQPDSSYSAQPASQEVTAREDVLRQAREAHKASLMVLCVMQDHAEHPNMRKDVAFAIEGNRNAIAAINEALQEPT